LARTEGRIYTAKLLRLLQLDDYGASFIFDEKFGVCTVTTVEAYLSRLVPTCDAITIQSRGFQGGVVFIDYDYILVMKVHWRRLTELPTVTPNDNSLVLQ
jgi:hypothetical protein